MRPPIRKALGLVLIVIGAVTVALLALFVLGYFLAEEDDPARLAVTIGILGSVAAACFASGLWLVAR